MGKESKRDIIWAEIRKQKTFTYDSIFSVTKIEKSTLTTYFRGLKIAGFIELVKTEEVNKNFVKTQFTSNVYRLIKDVGVDAPRVTRDGKMIEHDITQDLWRSMKILKSFTLSELIASTPRQTTFNTVKTYCVFLARAKYLRRIQNRYHLALYTGAKAPQIQRIKAVYDQNLQKVMWSSQGGEHDIY